MPVSEVLAVHPIARHEFTSGLATRVEPQTLPSLATNASRPCWTIARPSRFRSAQPHSAVGSPEREYLVRWSPGEVGESVVEVDELIEGIRP